MLLSTFLHLKGVGNKTEKSLWQRGVLTWEDYSPGVDQPYLLKELAPPSPLSSSIQAYEEGNVAFFAKAIPSSAQYRIALTYPEETLFLDIETTGLSHYYDIITMVGWSVGDKFEIFINGQDDSALRDALLNAKAIVTFNGTMFDLKFLEKYFPGITFPPVHIDLRYLSKRVGLSGGQKAIEKIIGYGRDQDVKSMLGEAAPILWHQYRRGEVNALKRLIVYNHEDVEGMKSIFDHCVDLLVEKECIPQKIRPQYRFSDHPSVIQWADTSSNQSTGILIPEYSGSTKPLINFEQLDNILPIQDFVVAGVDLVSSEEKESGCCDLRGQFAKTCRLKTDDEIIQWALAAGADLVSIDSPLSIPSGRTSFFDDDSHRDFGIMRQCERILKRRGVNVYPCLIQSMQKLTRRGMTLAEKFRQKGIPVIESYPGAAQDIMSIPRKQAGLDYLVQGLKEFGICGDFLCNSVSHDELDAITSAIVGLFFWTGMYEGLGNPQEEYLIIPDLNGDHKNWLNKKVVGVTGELELEPDVEKLLHTSGYVTHHLRELDCWLEQRQELKERSESLASEIGIEIDLRRKWLGKELMEEYKTNKNILIQGISALDDKALMIESFGPAFQMIDSVGPSPQMGDVHKIFSAHSV